MSWCPVAIVAGKLHLGAKNEFLFIVSIQSK